MRSVRRTLSPVAIVWLVSQVLAFALAPVSLCAMPSDAVAVQCTCAHDDGQPCPMHHHDTSSPCSCRGTSDSAALAMLSLISPPALVVPSVSAPRPIASPSLAHAAVFTVADGVSLVDLPPPRA
jgi:hypothetical protein